MLILRINKKIHDCLNLAESTNLSNYEEERITLELTHHFKKLLTQVLSKKEKEKYKKKILLISSLSGIQQLKKRLFYNGEFKFQKILSLYSNLNLLLFPKQDRTKEIILKNLLNIIEDHEYFKSTEKYYILESSPINIKISNKYHNLIHQLKHKKIKKLIISFEEFNLIKQTIQNQILQQTSDLIFTTKTPDDISNCFKSIIKLQKNNQNQSFGISINAIEKDTLAMLYKNIQSTPQNIIKKLNIRISKKYVNNNLNLLKSNTFYKWNIYTLLNLARKYQFRIFISSNNIYDISWILLLRSQLNIENQVQFETNISKFPYIAKILFMVNRSCIQSESIVITKKTNEYLELIFDKLIYQAKISYAYQNSIHSPSQVFIKSHRRFFNYLKRNFLQKYLLKFKIVD
ncbi:MAG: hypothetical protein VW397_08680 [Candidatus Margulisiibacteriota bacterium]